MAVGTAAPVNWAGVGVGVTTGVVTEAMVVAPPSTSLVAGESEGIG